MGGANKSQRRTSYMNHETETLEKLSKKLSNARDRLRFVEDFVYALTPLLEAIATNTTHPQHEAIMKLLSKVKQAKGNVGDYAP